MVLDMFCHWNYVLENLFGRVEAVTAKAVTHIPERWDEQGEPYDATADDAAYGIFELERRRHRPDQLVVGRAGRPRRARRVPGRRHPRLRGGRPVRLPHPAARGAPPSRCGTPTCRPPRTSAASGREVPDNQEFGNGFRAQWEQFLARRRRRPAAPLRLRGRRTRAAARRGRARSPRPRAGGSSARERRLTSAPPPASVRIPTRDGGLASRRAARAARLGGAPASRSRSRVAFAAAHVVADPRGDNVPGAPAVARLGGHAGVPARTCSATASASPRRWTPPSATWAWTGRRCRSWSRRSAEQARDHGARIAVRRRHRPPPATLGTRRRRARRLRRAGRVRRGHRLPGDRDGLAPARRGRAAARRLPAGVRRAARPGARARSILHWLGEAFDPQLRGYWGIRRRRRRRRRPSSTWSAPTPTRSTG